MSSFRLVWLLEQLIGIGQITPWPRVIGNQLDITFKRLDRTFGILAHPVDRRIVITGIEEVDCQRKMTGSEIGPPSGDLFEDLQSTIFSRPSFNRPDRGRSRILTRLLRVCLLEVSRKQHPVFEQQ